MQLLTAKETWRNDDEHSGFPGGQLPQRSILIREWVDIGCHKGDLFGYRALKFSLRNIRGASLACRATPAAGRGPGAVCLCFGLVASRPLPAPSSSPSPSLFPSLSGCRSSSLAPSSLSLPYASHAASPLPSPTHWPEAAFKRPLSGLRLPTVSSYDGRTV